MRVTIIGFGRIGQGICSKLISKKYIDEIFVFNEDEKRAEEAISKIKSKKVSLVKELPRTVEYIIITLSAMPEKARLESWKSRDTSFMVREDELKYNLRPMKDLMSSLVEISKVAKIIILTNPMDTFTNLFAQQLNKENIIGFGTALDCARYSKVLGKEVLCMGEHGRAVPLIGIKKEIDYITLHRAIDQKVVKFLREKGMTSEITCNEFSKFFDKLNGSKKSIAVFSYFLQKPFLGVANIAISIPYYVQSGKILSPAKLEISDAEKEIFDKQANDLKSRLAKLKH